MAKTKKKTSKKGGKKFKRGEKFLYKYNKKLFKQLHPTKNEGIDFKKLTCGSSQKLFWLCEKGHTFDAIVYNRDNGSECSYCSGKKAFSDNCLATLNEELAKEFHPTLNGTLTPFNVTSSSSEVINWICCKGHIWPTTINHRANGAGCPYCSGHKTCSDNCLAKLNKILAKEFHPTLNGNLTPYDFTLYSNEKVYWLCDKGHVWKAKICNRSNGTGCKTCKKSGTSDIERMFYYFLQLIFKKTISGYKLENKPKRDVEIDIFIPEINLGIEYDGIYYHSNVNVQKRDASKNIFLNKKQIPLLRIRDKGLPKIQDIEIICDNKNKNHFKNTLIEVINYICLNFKLNNKQKQKVEEVKNIDFDNYIIPKGFFEYPLKKDSLAKKNKKLTKQWHPTKNGALTPEHVCCGSDKKVYWLCDCGHVWKAKISNRNNSPICCCPKCSLRHQAKLKQKAVNQIDIKTNKIIKTFVSANQAGKELKILKSNISAVCTGLKYAHTAGGFKWEFVKKPKKK